MPVGYLWTVAVVSWGVACALTRWPRLGTFAALPALVVSELPFLVGYLLIASTVLALADGDLGSPAGAAAAVVALLALTGLVVIVRRALRAHAALHNTGKPGRPWGRILRAPFFPGRPGVVRVRGLAYGDGPDRTLDVYHRRDRPARTGPAALPWRRLLLRQQGPRSAAADPAPDQPARFRLRERGLPAAAARNTRRPGSRRARRDRLGTGPCRGVRRRTRHAVPRRQLGRGEPGDPGGVRRRDRHRGPDLPLRLLRRPRAARRPAAHAHRARQERPDTSGGRAGLRGAGHARCRAARSATPSCPAPTTTSTCTSPSGPPQSTRQWSSSPRGSALSPTQIIRTGSPPKTRDRRWPTSSAEKTASAHVNHANHRARTQNTRTVLGRPARGPLAFAPRS